MSQYPKEERNMWKEKNMVPGTKAPQIAHSEATVITGPTQTFCALNETGAASRRKPNGKLEIQCESLGRHATPTDTTGMQVYPQYLEKENQQNPRNLE